MIRLAFSSVADTAIIPLQDILGLDDRPDEPAGHSPGQLGMAIQEEDRSTSGRACGSPG